MHTTQIIPHISLCSGYEGIGLGLKRVIPGLRTIAYVEREAFAVANLVDKIEKNLLDAAPLYPDVETFPYREFYPLMGATDSVCTFGFPCQPHSCAGKREGAADERWLFDTIADGLALMRPRRVFIENVTGLLTSRMPNGQLCIDYIFARLAGIGYKMADHQERPLIEICSASECGAPHSRKRVFILGELADHPQEQPNGKECPALERGGGDELANSNHTPATRQRGNGRSIPGEPEPERLGVGSWPARPGQLQHPWESPRVVRVYLDLLQISERNGLDFDTVIEAFTRGLKRGVGSTVDGCIPGLADYIRAYSTRVDQLRGIGNGCVPDTVALAWTLLSERLTP